MAGEKVFQDVLDYVAKSNLNFSIFQTPFLAQFCLNPIRLGIWDLWVTLLKTHFGVSDPNSFLHSKLYIYKELRSKRILL